MSDKELLEYIQNKKWLCCCCHDLAQDVIKNGVKVIDTHEGMICGGVEDMYITRGRW